MSERARILVALLTAEQEYQRLQADDAQAAAARNGFELEVAFAENSAILQIQQLYKVIHRPPEERAKAIVVETVVGEGLERVARAATSGGVGWVLVNRRVAYLEDLRQKHPGLPICGVSTDQVEIGRIQARQFRALIASGQGLVLYVQGPPDTSAAQERLRGAQEVLAGSGIELRVLQGDWTEASGERAIQQWLRLRTSGGVRPDVVGCQNDSMAMGARRALERASNRPDLARVPLTGSDGLPDGGQRLVNMRQLAATVIAPSNTGPALDLVGRVLRSRQPCPPELLLKPSSYPDENELVRRRTTRRARSGP